MKAIGPIFNPSSRGYAQTQYDAADAVVAQTAVRGETTELSVKLRVIYNLGETSRRKEGVKLPAKQNGKANQRSGPEPQTALIWHIPILCLFSMKFL